MSDLQQPPHMEKQDVILKQLRERLLTLYARANIGQEQELLKQLLDTIVDANQLASICEDFGNKLSSKKE